MLRRIRKERMLWFKVWSLIPFPIILIIFSFVTVSYALDYPTRPIQIIVANPPGGGSDAIGRMFAPKLTDLLGKSVVVINKPGGGSVLGVYAAKAAAADGYTLLVTSASFLKATLAIKNVTYSPLKDFIPVNLSVTSPSVLVVKKDAPWLTLEDLLAEAKKNPGKLSCSVPSFGSTGHFALELFKIYAGINITGVPMEGVGGANLAVLGGHADFTIPELGAVTSHLEAGTLRPLAVMSKKRAKILPNAPTTVERGFPNIVTAAFQGFAVRAETPREIIDKLASVFKDAFKDKGMIDKFEKDGWVIENLGPEEAREFLTRQLQSDTVVAKAIKMVPK